MGMSLYNSALPTCPRAATSNVIEECSGIEAAPKNLVLCIPDRAESAVHWVQKPFICANANSRMSF